MSKSRLVLALAALIFLFWLGGHDLWAPDEPYFAEGAREMVVDGKWAVPHVNGKVTTDKPPLFFWLIALFSLVWGEVTPLTARLPSALAAIGTVAIAMHLARRFYGPKTGALAGLVLATSYMFWEKARWSQTDSLLCFLIWSALAAFALFRAGDMDGRKAGLIFWLAAAFAILDKGPVGLLLPLGIALVVLAGDRNFGSWKRFAPLAGPAAFAAVIAAWIALATIGGAGEYSVYGALKEHFIERGIHGYHHKQPPWYFLEVLPAVIMPWTFVIPGAMFLAWRRRLPADRLYLTIACFVVIFFSISTEKRELYALPAFPAFATMVAVLVGALCGWREVGDAEAGDEPPPIDPRWVSLGQGILGVLLIGTALYAPTARLQVPFVAEWIAWVFSLIVGSTGLAALYFAWRRDPLRATVAPALGMAVLYLFVGSVIWSAYEPIKTARPFTMVMKEKTQQSREAGLPVLCYRLDNLPEHFAFYSDGVYTLETEDLAVLEEHMRRPEKVFAVVNGDRLGNLAQDVRDRMHTVHTQHLARRSVLLVANRK